MPIKDPFPDPADNATYATGRSDASAPYRDLCSNCDNGEACRGGTRPRRPIFVCDEFVVSGALPAPELDRAVTEKPRETQNANQYIGLCVNCDNARTCISPKPEGGIWHCEEFR